MARSVFIVVSDDRDLIQKAQNFGQAYGVQVQVYSTSQWAEQGGNSVPSLASGQKPIVEGGKVLQFPANSRNDGRVETINDMESKAIENAIHAFRGNLTEAAKALGIGRATLYRKVKQYNIDPSIARKKRAA